MLWPILSIIAALAGIALGFILRSASAKSEKAQLEARNAELTREVATVRADLTQAQSESSARARFEALAGEREKLADNLRTELHAKSDSERTLAASVERLEAELRNERQNLAEKLALLETAKQSLSDQFQALAAGILDQKSKALSEGSQKELGALLDPLKTQIKEFREKVEKAQLDSSTGVAKLEGLIGNLGSLNLQLAEEAKNLSTALRGSAKAQGDWGEFILRDLLEKAGLREGEQYSFQQSFTGIPDENGGKRAARTDVILFLPGGRNLIIDSKVSLTAYTDFANAPSDLERNASLKLHLASVRGHVGNLSKAGYQRLPGIESPDFVVMFIPIEPAFLLALQNDAELWSDAYRQGILLVGPTTLLYIIRIVNVLWQQEQQARSVQDVMNRGTALYEKFVGFVSDLEAVGNSLSAADRTYAAAMKKLSEGPGNLIRQVEMLKKLGLRTTKSLPQNLLDAAEAHESGLTLAAEAETSDTDS